MSEQLFDQFADLPALEAQRDFILKEIFGKMKEAVLSMKEIGIGLDNAKSVKQVSELAKEMERLHKLQGDYGKQLAFVKVQQLEVNKANKEAAKDALGLNDAYKQLVIRFAAAAAVAKNLAAQYGVHSKEAQKAAKEANNLNNQLKAIDTSIGNNQRNVGAYGSAFDKAGESVKRFGSQLLAAIGVFSVIDFLKGASDEFLEMDKNLRILENTLKNVGAPELFGRITKSANDLAKQFKFIDNDEVVAVFNKLIVYGKLTEKQINDLLPVIISFSTATGQTLEQSSSVLIKAIEGNGKALKEFGINMKDAKTPAEGLSLIMKELAPRIKGVADAFGETAAGKIAIAKQEFKNLKEEVGTGLIPIFVSLLGYLNKAIIGAQRLWTDLKNIFSAGGRAKSFADLQEQSSNEIAQKNLDEDKAFLDKSNATVQARINLFNNRVAYNNKVIEQKQKEIEQSKFDGKSDEFRQDLKDFIRNRQAEIKLYQSEIDSLNNTKVVGLGGTATGAITTKEKGPGKDTKAELFKQLQERRKAEQEALKQRISDNILADLEVLDSDKKTFFQRLDAAKAFYDDSAGLLLAQKKFELNEVDSQAAEDKRKAQRELKGADLTNTLTAIDKARAAKRLAIEDKFNSDVLNLDKESEKQIQALTIKHNDALAQLRRSGHDNKLAAIQNEGDALLEEENKAYLKKVQRDKGNNEKLEKDKREHEINLFNIQIDTQRRILEADIAFAQAELDIEKARVNAEPDSDKKTEDLAKIATAEQALSGLRIKLGALHVSSVIKNNEDIKKSDQEVFDKKIKQLEEIAQYAKEVFDIIGGFIAAGVTKELNGIQSQMDALDRKKAKDIEVVNSGIGSAEHKANAIAAIEARAQAQHEILDIKKRQAQERQARFEKAANIAAIIMETALAVMRALADKTTPSIFGRIAGAAIIGAIGAAKLAVAIATPIPKFFRGTQSSPEGLAEVAELGPELAVDPKGQTKLFENRSLVYLEKGTKIYPADVTKGMLAASLIERSNVMKSFAGNLSTSTPSNRELIEKTDVMIGGLNKVIRELKEINQKSGIEIHNEPSIETTAWYKYHLKGTRNSPFD